MLPGNHVPHAVHQLARRNQGRKKRVLSGIDPFEVSRICSFSRWLVKFNKTYCCLFRLDLPSLEVRLCCPIGNILFYRSPCNYHTISFLDYHTISLLSCLLHRSDEGLTLETSAFLTIYGGQFTFSTQLFTLNFLQSQQVVVSFVILFASS